MDGLSGLDADDVRMRPLYRAAKVARYVGVNVTTLRTWTYGYTRRFPDRPAVRKAPMIAATGPRGGTSIPFIGLAEAMVLVGFREAKLPMQQVRRAVGILQAEIGLEHVLASRRLYSDGAKVLYDFAERYEVEEIGGLVVVATGQRVFRPVIEKYLTRITFDHGDGFASRLGGPLETSPPRNEGQPCGHRPIRAPRPSRIVSMLDYVTRCTRGTTKRRAWSSRRCPHDRLRLQLWRRSGSEPHVWHSREPRRDF